MLNYLQPKNLETEAQGSMQDLETRKRIAELMSGIATQQLQAPTSGGVAGRLPGWAPLVQALAGGLAGMQQKGILEGQQKILQQQEAGDQEALSGLMRAGQVQPAKEIAGPALPGTTMPTIPASGGPFSPEYKSALLSMIAKGSPRLQPFAKAELEHVNKNTIGPVDLAPRATLSSIQANPNDPSQWKPKQDIHTVDGSIYNVGEEGQVNRLGGSSYAEPFLIGNDMYQNETGTGKILKLDNAPNVTVGGTSVVNAGQNAGMKAYWENAAKTVDTLGQQAQSAQNNLNSLSELKNLHDKGLFSNAPSGIQSFAANLGQAFGIPVDQAKLANTETYNAGITDLWQGLVSKYGGSRGRGRGRWSGRRSSRVRRAAGGWGPSRRGCRSCPAGLARCIPSVRGAGGRFRRSSRFRQSGFRRRRRQDSSRARVRTRGASGILWNSERVFSFRGSSSPNNPAANVTWQP
jgi:hypothetical protein